MADVTRLRHVSGKSLAMVEGWINKLPFKVELKEILSRREKGKDVWYIFFVIPEDDTPQMRKFASVQL